MNRGILGKMEATFYFSRHWKNGFEKDETITFQDIGRMGMKRMRQLWLLESKKCSQIIIIMSRKY